MNSVIKTFEIPMCNRMIPQGVYLSWEKNTPNKVLRETRSQNFRIREHFFPNGSTFALGKKYWGSTFSLVKK